MNPVTSDRRHRRSLQIRERLFRSALDLFAQRGFSDTTVEDITNAADLGKGTFFNYFPSKDHLLLAFADMQLTKLQSFIEHLRSTAEPLPEFLRTLAMRMTENRAAIPPSFAPCCSPISLALPSAKPCVAIRLAGMP